MRVGEGAEVALISLRRKDFVRHVGQRVEETAVGVVDEDERPCHFRYKRYATSAPALSLARLLLDTATSLKYSIKSVGVGLKLDIFYDDTFSLKIGAYDGDSERKSRDIQGAA